ncbi:hypothetical protein T484DRAFT_1783868 [Baffinella frigidus]|nr:hypothetical protein T484DRAFT_1783868 [Cryptophyta sp. CCMP2293]
MAATAGASMTEEKARISREHARLERQAQSLDSERQAKSLDSERQVMKESMQGEMARMEDQHRSRTLAHQAFTGEMNRERAALADQRSALLAAETELRRREELAAAEQVEGRKFLEGDKERAFNDRQALVADLQTESR